MTDLEDWEALTDAYDAEEAALGLPTEPFQEGRIEGLIHQMIKYVRHTSSSILCLEAFDQSDDRVVDAFRAFSCSLRPCVLAAFACSLPHLSDDQHLLLCLSPPSFPTLARVP